MSVVPQDLISKHSLTMNLVSEHYNKQDVLSDLQQEFGRNDYVKLPGLIASQAFAHIRAEIEYLKRFTTKRSFIMEGYETPREMSTLGGAKILKEAPTIWSLYCHYELRNLIERIAGTKVYSCLHPNEFMVANFLNSPGATHGWHLDDPAFALIIVLEASSAEDGGSLEFIPNWFEFCSQIGAFSDEKVGPLVERARADNLIQVRHHLSGDAYFLRADRSLHQVTALRREGACRSALNLAFEVTPNPTYGDTANKLYGES
jgi:hypothetical protein